MWTIAFFFATFGQAPATAPATTSVDAERTSIQGSWRLLIARSLLVEPDRNEQEPDWHFEKDKIRFDYFVAVASTKDLKRGATSKCTLDPSKRPPTIDLSLDGGQEVHGIYLLVDDTLAICLASPGASRPTGFTAGAQRELLQFRRAESKTKGPTNSEKK